MNPFNDIHDRALTVPFEKFKKEVQKAIDLVEDTAHKLVLQSHLDGLEQLFTNQKNMHAEEKSTQEN